LLIIYITTYISYSYIDYKGGCIPHFLIVTTVTVTQASYSLFYQAFQSLANLTVHLEGVVVNTKVLANLRHRLEVRPQRAVVPAGNGDVLAVEDARVLELFRACMSSNAV